MAGFEYTETIKVEITDDHIDSIIEMARFGGIGYWADTLDQFADERRIEIMEHEGLRPIDKPAVEITYQAIADAVWQIHLGNSSVGYVKEYIDSFVKELQGEDARHAGAELDADAADAIIQVAMFGDIVYG